MNLSVGIVNHETRRELLASMGAILADAPGAEVVVHDNGSRDGSVEAAREAFPGIRVLAGRANRGFAAAANRLIRETRGDYILLLNPDAVVRPGACALLVEHLERHPEVAIAGPRLLDPDGSLQFSRRAFPGHWTALGHRTSVLTRLWPGNPWSRRYLRPDLGTEAPASVDWVSGAAMLLRRSALDRIGVFDERFFLYVEDVDLCLRARRAGWEVAWVPAAVAIHRIGASSRRNPRRALLERHRSMWRYYAKHLRGGAITDLATLVALGVRLGTGLVSCGLRPEARAGELRPSAVTIRPLP